MCPGARPIGSWSSSCWALGPITFESWDQCRWVLKPAPLGPVAHPIDIHAGSRFVFCFLFFCVALRSRPRTVQGRLHHTGASQAESKARPGRPSGLPTRRNQKGHRWGRACYSLEPPSDLEWRGRPASVHMLVSRATETCIPKRRDHIRSTSVHMQSLSGHHWT